MKHFTTINMINPSQTPHCKVPWEKCPSGLSTHSGALLLDCEDLHMYILAKEKKVQS